MGEAAFENSKQHDNEVLSTQGAGKFSKAC